MNQFQGEIARKRILTSSRAQSAVEYLILVAFVSVAVTIVLILAYFYASISNDTIRVNQIEAFTSKIISYSESVYYSGEPSQASITVYIPKGLSSVIFSGKEIIVTATLSSGEYVRSFQSRVDLQGTLNPSEGSRKLVLRALSDRVTIN